MNELIEELEFFLKLFLNTCQVGDDGKVQETRQRVDLLKGRLKIEIYPKEHAPAHFHVKYNDLDASFRIDDCEKLAGLISDRDYRIVQHWYNHSKSKLIKVWNQTRPTDCSVGDI